jgi:putative FmdB family regulatory protein
MPTYEYLCKACGTRFEVWQHMTDEPLTTCPSCHGEVHRVLYPAGIVFKGTGFYKTDYSSSSRASADGHKGPAKSETSAKSGESSGSGETKKSSGNEPAKAGAAAQS